MLSAGAHLLQLRTQPIAEQVCPWRGLPHLQLPQVLSSAKLALCRLQQLPRGWRLRAAQHDPVGSAGPWSQRGGRPRAVQLGGVPHMVSQVPRRRLCRAGEGLGLPGVRATLAVVWLCCN